MRWVLELSPTPTRAFGNIPSAFVNGKNLSEILFFLGYEGHNLVQELVQKCGEEHGHAVHPQQTCHYF